MCLFCSVEKYKEVKQLALLCGLQKCSELGLNSLWVALPEGAYHTLHIPSPQSSFSTSSLSFFHGPVNLSQERISN
jgi:hypothetical protein